MTQVLLLTPPPLLPPAASPRIDYEAVARLGIKPQHCAGLANILAQVPASTVQLKLPVRAFVCLTGVQSWIPGMASLYTGETLLDGHVRTSAGAVEFRLRVPVGERSMLWGCSPTPDWFRVTGAGGAAWFEGQVVRPPRGGDLSSYRIFDGVRHLARQAADQLPTTPALNLSEAAKELGLSESRVVELYRALHTLPFGQPEPKWPGRRPHYIGRLMGPGGLSVAYRVPRVLVKHGETANGPSSIYLKVTWEGILLYEGKTQLQMSADGWTSSGMVLSAAIRPIPRTAL